MKMRIEWDKCVFDREILDEETLIHISYMRITSVAGDGMTLLTCVPLTPSEQLELDDRLEREIGASRGTGKIVNLRQLQWHDGVRDAIKLVASRQALTPDDLDETLALLEAMLERGSYEAPWKG